jgi:hypothetical protein
MPVRILVESPSSSLVFLLQPRNYTQLHNKLRSLLGEGYRLFSRPDVYSGHTTWSVDVPDGSVRVRGYGDLSATEKSLMDERISVLVFEARSVLSADRELSSLVEYFFEIPGLEDIHAYEVGGVLQPVFTRWGCRVGKERVGANPLEHILDRNNAPVSPVRLRIRYNDGRIASGEEFLFSFSGKEARFMTDESGEYDLGKLRQGTQFTVYGLLDGEKDRSYDFSVEPGGLYEVIWPVYTEGEVRVEDQHGKPLKGFRFRMRQGRHVSEHSTDAEGKAHVSGLEVGGLVELESVDRKGTSIRFEPKGDEREWLWRVEESYRSSVRISTRSSDGVLSAGQSLMVSVGGDEGREMQTGSGGWMELQDLEPGTVVAAWTKSNPGNRVGGALKEGLNEFELTMGSVPSGVEGGIRVRVLNHRGERLKDTRVETEYRGGLSEHRTDGEGEILLSREGMIDESRVKARVHVLRLDRKGVLRDRVHSKSFLYTTNREEYELRLTRVSRWWWLAALLLLPLLLLIRFEKTIHVKAYGPDKVSPMPDIDVSLMYHKGYLYDEGRFLTRDTVRFIQPTDGKGQAQFEKLAYSLYSYVLQHDSPLEVFGWDECFVGDTLSKYFHSVSDGDTLKLYMTPIVSSMGFRLIDEQTIQPLPGVKAVIVTKSGGRRYTDSAISNSEGKVVFRNIPVCGRVVELLGEHAGYLSYRTTDKEVVQFGEEGSSSRVLPLRRDPRMVYDGSGPVEYTGELQTIPCDENVKSGGQGVTDIVHPLGSQPGLVILVYDMADIPDRITITHNGRVVASTGGLVSGRGSLKWYYYPQAGEPNYCTVNISAPQDGTIWQYVLGCPAPLGLDSYYYKVE